MKLIATISAAVGSSLFSVIFSILSLLHQISKELEDISLPPDVKQAVVECLWPRRDEIRQSLSKHTATISNAHLKDFDWKVKVRAVFPDLVNTHDDRGQSLAFWVHESIHFWVHESIHFWIV